MATVPSQRQKVVSRGKMVREAAYFRSQHRSPGYGREVEDWLAAAGPDTRSDCDRSKRMSSVEIEQCAVSIDAAIIAAGFAIEPALVQPLMREGQITSLCEHGVDRDAGRYRLTFFHGKQRFRLMIDAAGNILERSTTEENRETT